MDFFGGKMEDYESPKFILKRICPGVAPKQTAEFTIYGMKCKGSDGAIGWVLFAQASNGERGDYWVTNGKFYSIPQSETKLLYNLDATEFEFREGTVEPKEGWKVEMLATISEWESRLAEKAGLK
jgi:hypothetical protein